MSLYGTVGQTKRELVIGVRCLESVMTGAMVLATELNSRLSGHDGQIAADLASEVEYIRDRVHAMGEAFGDIDGNDELLDLVDAAQRVEDSIARADRWLREFEEGMADLDRRSEAIGRRLDAMREAGS